MPNRRPNLYDSVRYDENESDDTNTPPFLKLIIHYLPSLPTASNPFYRLSSNCSNALQLNSYVSLLLLFIAVRMVVEHICSHLTTQIYLMIIYLHANAKHTFVGLGREEQRLRRSFRCVLHIHYYSLSCARFVDNARTRLLIDHPFLGTQFLFFSFVFLFLLLTN